MTFSDNDFLVNYYAGLDCKFANLLHVRENLLVFFQTVGMFFQMVTLNTSLQVSFFFSYLQELFHKDYLILAYQNIMQLSKTISQAYFNICVLMREA